VHHIRSERNAGLELESYLYFLETRTGTASESWSACLIEGRNSMRLAGLFGSTLLHLDAFGNPLKLSGETCKREMDCIHPCLCIRPWRGGHGDKLKLGHSA
jgi:hypothetical protein